MLEMDTTGWMFFSHAERQSLMAAGEMTLVMVKGPAHLWSSFFMGRSEEEFWRLSHTLSPTLYSGALWQLWCRWDNGPISELPTETKLMARACHYHHPEICYELDMQKLSIPL